MILYVSSLSPPFAILTDGLQRRQQKRDGVRSRLGFQKTYQLLELIGLPKTKGSKIFNPT